MSVVIGEISISCGRDGKMTERFLMRCFEVGHFAAHETRNNPRFWTCSHKPTGLAVATYITSAFEAIECAQRADALAREVGLDTSPDTTEALTAQLAWQGFKARGAELRKHYTNRPIVAHDEDESE